MRTPLLLLTTALFAFAPSANAQLAIRQSEVVEGAYSMIGNLLIDCPTAATCDNNTAMMTAVDVDQDASTAMSSSATLQLPPGAAVRTAILYVSCSGTETTAGTNPGPWIPADLASYSVRFAGPAQPYSALVPADVQSNGTDNAYLARFDVTALVNGSGEYFVADALLSPATHPFNRILSWVLFVTYDDGSPPVLVNLYDGTLTCFMGSTAINLAGFRTPAIGAPSALFTAWSVDGHPTISGESITVGTRQVSNPQNPSNNIGNATVTSPAGPIPRNPASFRVTEEMDLDTFDVSSSFTVSQSNVDITFTCGNQEGVVYQAAVIGVEIVSPVIEVEKTVFDVNGGETIAGDELSYELRVRTTGGDDAIDVVLRDLLPEGVSYIAESIEYVSPIAGMKTDLAGDDEAEWTGSELIFRIGEGASNTAGGTIAVGLEQLVRFHARVESTTVARNIVNLARLTARGAQGGSGATLIEVVSSSVAVEVLPCAGFENGSCPDAGVVEDDAAIEDAAIEDAAVEPAPDAEPATDAEPAADADPAPDAAPAADAALLPDAGPLADAGAAGFADAAVIAADAGASEENGDGCGCSAEKSDRAGSRDLLALGSLFALAVGTRRRRRTAVRS